MRYSFIVAVLLGALITVGRAEDEKPSRAQAAFDKIWKEIRSRPRKFEPKDGPRILAGLYRSRLPEADNRKLMEHAKNNPKDPSAAEALMMVVLFNNADTSKDGPRAQALALLRKDHLKGPTITRRLVIVMAHSHGDLEELAREVANTHPNKRTRALAYRALIQAGEDRIHRAEPLKQDPEKFEKRFGESLYDRYGGPEIAKKMLENARAAEQAIPEYRAKLEGELKGVLADVSVGAKAPPTEMVDFKGKPVKLSDFKGKVVVLQFWISSAFGHTAPLPHGHELATEMKGRPFAFISISMDEDKETVQKRLEKQPMLGTHCWTGPQGQLLETWDEGIRRNTFVIDHQGVIRHVLAAGDGLRNYAHAIEQLVKAAETEGEGKKGKER